MEESYIAVTPQPEEKKQLRLYYFKLGLIMLMMLLIFNGLNRLMVYVCSGIIGGGTDSVSIDAGKKIMRDDPAMRSLVSYVFPIAAEIAAITVGMNLTGTRFKDKFNLKNVTTGGMFSFTAISFGVMTVAAFLNQILTTIILSALGKGENLNDSMTSASITPAGNNPLWINILIYMYICVLGPILEELVFRGVLLDGLTKYGNAFGIAATAILFGLMHQNYLQCIPAIGIGLCFAYMDIKCGSVIPSVIVHILNNSLSALLMAMLENVDLKALTNMTDIEAAEKFFLENIPLMAVLSLNMLMRLACIIAAIVIAISYRTGKRRLIDNNDYCRKRTWGYFFTSVPWVLSMGYMLYSTVTSLPL